MSNGMSPQALDPAEIELLERAHGHWAAGNEAAALEILQERVADSNESWLHALISWLMLKRGASGYEASIKHARMASERGMPWQAFHVFNTVVINLEKTPELENQVIELLVGPFPATPSLDIISMAWDHVSNGSVALGLRLMQITESKEPGATMLERGQEDYLQLREITTSARELADLLSAESAEAMQSISKVTGDLKTSAKQAGLLVATTTSDATNALFKADAQRNSRESRFAWYAGLLVLAAAVAVAVLPLILHYRGQGPGYSTSTLIGAHAASTLALATFAGVLLARARSRDLASQRANDLSTAMGTMVAYSRQIGDQVERERFMMTMGQLVLQAHLTSGTGHHGADEAVPGLLALTNLIKSPGGSPS